MNNNIDWSQLIKREMKESQVITIQRAKDTIVEDEWRTSELLEIADQLLAIEDDDPNAFPGTDRQWRDYRIAVRAWKDGDNLNFPDKTKRPVRPFV